jgi:hypothetical protein
MVPTRLPDTIMAWNHPVGKILDNKSCAICEAPRCANIPQQDDGSSFLQQQPVWRERGGVEVVEHLQRNGTVSCVLVGLIHAIPAQGFCNLHGEHAKRCT